MGREARRNRLNRLEPTGSTPFRGAAPETSTSASGASTRNEPGGGRLIPSLRSHHLDSMFEAYSDARGRGPTQAVLSKRRLVGIRSCAAFRGRACHLAGEIGRGTFR